MKVFVIEDNPVYNDYVCNLLKKDSFDTMSAKTLKGHYGERVYDRSALYDGCKDLNEYLQLTTKKEQ